MVSASLLAQNATFQRLRAACAELGVPSATALELVRFLVAARATKGGFLDVSPSEHLDALWHYVLLNTAVRPAVYELVGGEVAHSTSTAGDCNGRKLTRMANAMAMLDAAGWTPQPAAWRAAAPASAASSEPGVGGLRRVTVRVWDATGTDHPEEVAAYHWYDASTEPAADAAADGGQDETERTARERRARADVQAQLEARGYREVAQTDVGGAEWAGRCRAFMQVFVKMLTSETKTFKMRFDATGLDLKLAVQEISGIPPDQSRLIFAGMQLQDGARLVDEGVRAESTAHLTLRLAGC